MNRNAGNLFRERSLDSLNSPERLDELVTVTSPRLWLMLIGALLVASAMAAWFFFGTVSVVIHGQGILIPKNGLLRVDLPQKGILKELKVQTGDEVKPGQVLALLQLASSPLDTARLNNEVLTPRKNPQGGHPSDRPSLEGKEPFDTLPILSPGAGRVVELLAAQGQSLHSDAPLLSLAPSDQELEARVFIPFSQSRRLRPKTPVQIVPASAPKGESEQMMGRVEEIAELPASPEFMLNLLQNPRLVDHLSPQGQATCLVRVRLDKGTSLSSVDASGGSSSSSLKLRAGTLCDAAFVVRKLRPYQLGFGSRGKNDGQ